LLRIGEILNETESCVGGVAHADAAATSYLTVIVPFGLKIVVPTPVLVSTALSHCCLPVVSVNVWVAVPSEIVMIGAVAQVVTFCELAMMRVMFAAFCTRQLHIR